MKLSEKFKDPKYTKHKFAIIALLVCVIGGLGYYVYNALNWPADKICRALVNQVSTLELVTIEGDTNDNISYFNDSTIKQEGVSYTGMIEVFDNKTEALLKKEYYELYDSEMHKVFNSDLLGTELSKTYGTGKWNMYVNGNTLIRLSYHYSSYKTEQLVKKFNIVMEKTYQTDKNVPTESEQKQIQKNYKKQVEDAVKNEKDQFIASLDGMITTLKAEVDLDDTSIDRLLEIKDEVEKYKNVGDLGTKALEVQNAVEKKIKSQADAIDAILDDAQNNYSRDKVQEAKDAIALLTHRVFDEYKQPWNDRIDQILYLIKEKEIQEYKDKCQEFSYDEIDESYEGEYAYFYGKIKAVSTNTSGRITLIVSVTPQYFFGSVAGWEDEVYVDLDNEISGSYGKDDLIQMWGQINGMVVNEQVFGSAKYYPSFYCKYASE
jgi:hypothetical protein